MKTLGSKFRFVLPVFGLFVLLVLRPFRRLIHIQLCVAGFHRFGHLALEPEMFLCQPVTERQAAITVSVWSLGKRSNQTNRYLVSKWKEVLLVFPSWIVDALLRAGKLVPHLALEQPALSIHGPNNGLDRKGPHLKFSEREQLEGKRKLRAIGIDPELPYACLIVRDGSHYASLGEPESPGYSILNCDIERFEETALVLAQEGIQVIRMGAGSEPPLRTQHPKVIDYATSGQRTEFLDVYIAGSCTFAISTQTGPDAVCLAFRRPVYYVDVVRFSQFFFGTQCACWSPATIFNEGKKMNLNQIVSHDVMWLEDPDEFARRGITIERSSSAEIASMSLAFARMVKNKDFSRWQFDGSNQRAKAILRSGLGYRGDQIFGVPTAYMNQTFLRLNADWFLAD